MGPTTSVYQRVLDYAACREDSQPPTHNDLTRIVMLIEAMDRTPQTEWYKLPQEVRDRFHDLTRDTYA